MYTHEPGRAIVGHTGLAVRPVAHPCVTDRTVELVQGAFVTRQTILPQGVAITDAQTKVGH